MPITVAVGLSGGVDSAVSAHLLKSNGYNVIGVNLVLWRCNQNINSASCCNAKATQDASKIANDLGIQFKVIDAQQTFMDHTVKPMVKDYENGLTPSPCILCNATTKINSLYQAVNGDRSVHLATGHYANTKEIDDQFFITRAKDLKKDQSYFLYRIPKDIIPQIHFPLGGFSTKMEIREIANKIGIHVAAKPDSTDLCMVPGGNISEFLFDFGGLQKKRGPIVYKNMVIGQHNGVWGKTKGQRKGIGLHGTPIPLFVDKVDVNNNVIYVDTIEKISTNDFTIKNELFPGPFYDGMEVVCQVRYRGTCTKAKLYKSDSVVKVLTDDPVVAAPGQHAVFYDLANDVCLGGGEIE
jgi:tRNA-specific 2-thiouridylase